MDDIITCIEVPKEIVVNVICKLNNSRYCKVTNILPLNKTHFLVLVKNDNYDIREIKRNYIGIDEAFSEKERDKFRYSKISED